MNERGQEFAGFRLLVEAVMVIFILSIILVTVSQIERIRQDVSERQLFEGFDKAVNSPDGSVVVSENIVLVPMAAYSRGSFSTRAIGMQLECVEIDASDSSAFTLVGSSRVEIKSMVQANIYYRCETLYNGGDCDIRCVVSFGKELEGG